MKAPVTFAIIALSIGIISYASAGPAPVSGNTGGFTTEPVVSGATSSTDRSPTSINAPGTATTGFGTTSATAGGAPTATPGEDNTDENDDTLYRGKTGESENPMLRDEGPLHFKTHPKEKVQEVDSLKKLPSSGLDPKFQGTLLNSDLNAIAKISGKANENREETVQSDPRFKTTRLTFTPAKSDEPKGAQSDSSPSPTPSPTVSPAAKSSGEPKQ